MLTERNLLMKDLTALNDAGNIFEDDIKQVRMELSELFYSY
jgi:hypothetical protein